MQKSLLAMSPDTLANARIAMDYQPAGTLADIMRVTGPMTESEVSAFLVELLVCAAFFEKTRVTYSGFVASNIMIRDDNQMVLIDLGSADRCGLAPHRLYPGCSPSDGTLTPAFDINMLGRLAVSMLMGKPETVKSVPAGKAALSSADYVMPDAATLGISDEMHALLSKATATDPSQRFASALEMAEALEAIPTAQVSADGVRQTLR